MECVIVVNGEERAMFKEELDAMQYRDFLKKLYKMGGYKDKVEIERKKWFEINLSWLGLFIVVLLVITVEILINSLYLIAGVSLSG